jgi:hypothetical protein
MRRFRFGCELDLTRMLRGLFSSRFLGLGRRLTAIQAIRLGAIRFFVVEVRCPTFVVFRVDQRFRLHVVQHALIRIFRRLCRFVRKVSARAFTRGLHLRLFLLNQCHNFLSLS